MRMATTVMCAASLALGIVTAGIAPVAAADHNVYKLYYKNNGAYLVNWVEVFWEKDGDKSSRKYNNVIAANDMFCFSADEWNTARR